MFQGLAQRGRTAMGFFGLKFHPLINHQDPIIAFKITGAIPMTANRWSP